MPSDRSQRIAMWAGPAEDAALLMRAWGNRSDTFVRDEPFYPHYLQQTAPDDPLTLEVCRHREADPVKVVESLTGPIPEGKTVLYQKHSARHLLPDVGRDWLDRTFHCFLIRDPREQINALSKRISNPLVEHTGLREQVELYEHTRVTLGHDPPIVDMDDLLEDPSGMLERLCAACGLDFDARMLSWEPGPRETDGVWGKRDYAAAMKRTGFPPPTGGADTLLSQHMATYLASEKLYRKLYRHRLGGDS